MHAEVGPDGALWLLDFYDFIIQHNPTPIGPIAQEHPFQNGVGNAYDTPLREHDRGRIYRLVWKGARPYTPLSLSVNRPVELVQALRHDNMFWRTTAQRLLVERGKTDVVPQIIEIVNDRTVDKIGLNSPAVHALWTLHGLGVLDGSSAAALDAATRAPLAPRRRRAQGGAVGAAPDAEISRGSALGRRAHRQGSERAAERAARTLEDACVGRSRSRHLSCQQGSGGRRGRVAAGGRLDCRDQAPGRLPESVRRRHRTSRGDQGRGPRGAWRAGRRRGLVGAGAHGCRLESCPGPEGLERDRHRRSRGHDLAPAGDRRTGERCRQASGDSVGNRGRLRCHLRQRCSHRRHVHVAQPAAAVQHSRRCPDRRVERDRRAHFERQRPWRVRARSGAGARCVAAGDGIRAERHGHRRRRLHHPPRR